MGNLASWDFDFLAKNNRIALTAKIRQRQRETGVPIGQLAQGFVSWLLYAYSPAGRRIEDPVALATKRLLENINAGAGGDFDRLARLQPCELKALFDRDLAGRLIEVGGTVGKSIYRANYRDLARPKKLELYRRLFGDQESHL